MLFRRLPVAASLVAVCLLGLGTGVSRLAAQSNVSLDYPEEARNLVVGLEVVLRPTPEQRDGGIENGAGIVFAAPTPSTLFVVTAYHVVDGASEIRTTFPFDPSSTHLAELMWSSPGGPQGGTDVAVLRVEVTAEIVQTVVGSFDRRGRPGSLGTGSAVFPVGCPSGQCFGIPGAPDRVLSSTDLVLDFQSAFATSGSSGGALFNDSWELVGMVVRNNVPRAEAIPVDFLMQIARTLAVTAEEGAMPAQEWDGMTSLGPPAVPRGGYRTTFGLSMMNPFTQTAPISATNPPIELSGFLESRLPSLRFTIHRQSEAGNDWHVGVMRLAPYNVSVTAFVAGVATEFRTSGGRVMLRPFVEGGFARVEARHDVGGFFVGSPDPSNYEPVWAKVERDAIGFGGGATFELTLMPSVILEFDVGGWSFGMPTEISDVPRFYSGAGLRIGR